MMIRKVTPIFGICAAVVLTFTLSSPIARAHVLEENNGISAVLHIPPDDNPVAAKSMKLVFEFDDHSGKFDINNCDCKVGIVSKSKTIQTERLTGNMPTSGEATVMFPSIGVYTLKVSGSSMNDSFNDFELSYLQRVASSVAVGANSSDKSMANTITIISLASFVTLGMFAYSFILRGERYRPKNK